METNITDYIDQGHFLAFVDFVGKTIDGKNIYRFDFTQATDIVWGELWNATPAGIIPNLEPDKNCLSISAQLLTKNNYILAKNNTCFSMQDCIDGILPLLFDEPYSDNLLVLPFGISLEETINKLNDLSLELVNAKVVSEEMDDEVINGLIDKLETDINQPTDGDLDDEDF